MDVLVTTSTGGRAWSKPARLGYGGFLAPLVAAGPGGQVVVGLNPGALYTSRSGTALTKAKAAGVDFEDRVLGVASDAHRRLHFLVARVTTLRSAGLWYVTDASGRWTRTRIAGTSMGDAGRLSWDPVKDSIVIAYRHRSAAGDVVKVSVTRATATHPAAFVPWLTDKPARRWEPESLAVRGGTVTLAVQRATAAGTDPADGPYVVTGTSSWHHRPTRVPGTTTQDTHVVVTAPAAKGIVVEWRRGSPTWDTRRLGIWTRVGAYSTTKHDWVFAGAKRWSPSAYDFPAGAFADTSGHVSAVYTTAGGKVGDIGWQPVAWGVIWTGATPPPG